MIQDLIVCILLLSGSLLILFASIGIARFKDTLGRAHALTKATTFAVTLLLCALGLALENEMMGMRLILVIFFCLLTIPLSSHLVAWLYYRHLYQFDEEAKNSPDLLPSKKGGEE